MENSLFPFKYRLRKTDEQVEIVAWETAEKGARSENDWVSYIDASGVEHVKEHLTLEWDFKVDSPFGDGFGSSLLDSTLKSFDAWEARRYELVKQLVIEKERSLEAAIEIADGIIAALKPKEEKEDPNKGL